MIIAGETGYLRICSDIFDPDKTDSVIFSVVSYDGEIKLSKTYPETGVIESGFIAIPLSQHDTASIEGYNRVESQINYKSGAVKKTEPYDLYVASSDATKYIDGSVPNVENDYEDIKLQIESSLAIPENVIVEPIEGGNRVTIGDKSFDVMDGNDYVLTDKDQADIAEKTAMLSTVGRYATVPADAWSDDTDLLSNQRVQRLAYRISKSGSHKDIIEHNWNNATDAILSEDWQTFEASFVFSPTDNTDQLYLLFYGGKSASFCHPYDIADVKLWLASDAERTNLFPEDIAKLNWWWHYDTSTCPEVNRFSVAYDDDGHKYIHVWRQNAFETADGKVAANLAYLRAGTGVKLTAGETYVLSVRMRSTCSQHTAIAECEGICDHSATVVSPVPTSTAAFLNSGVRAFGQRLGELMLKADTVPTDGITVGIQAMRGQGTGVIINNVMPELAGALDAALLNTIGSGEVS